MAIPQAVHQEPAELTSEQLEHLHRKLLETRDEIIRRTRLRIAEALENEDCPADEADVAAMMSSQAFGLRLADKDRKLLSLVEHALDKFANGDYGYCEGTGEPIEPARLEIRPWVRYSVEYQEQIEKERKLHSR